jgi:predicted ABC-type ATPase
MSAPRLIFLAGPNGAGKSTFHEAFLQSMGLPFINADELVAALGISSDEAARAADAARRELLAARASFVTETVFSDPVGAKLDFLHQAVGAGYETHLIYIGIASPMLSQGRVRQRAAAGGHDVPADRLQRRYRQSLANLRTALAFVPDVTVFDNSSTVHPFQLVLEQRRSGRTFTAAPFPRWARSVVRP